MKKQNHQPTPTEKGENSMEIGEKSTQTLTKGKKLQGKLKLSGMRELWKDEKTERLKPNDFP